MQRVAIVVCTYNRPALLAAALDSILKLRPVAGTALDVVVVDNSDAGSARAGVQRIAAAAAIPIRYVEAHPPNIALARNAGIAATDAPVIAFLDDDQELVPGWLEAVTEGLRTFPYDAFFGPITPRFEDEAGASPLARRMFTRAFSGPAGSELRAYERRAEQDFVLSTANSIFRRASTLASPAPFVEAFGHGGGEDVRLLFELQRGGRRYGWLPAAGASDFVPRHRSETAYLVARHYTGGQIFAAALIRSSRRPRIDCLTIWAKALSQLAVLCLAALPAAAKGAAGRAHWRMRVAGSLGKLMWPSIYPLYRVEERGLAGNPPRAPAAPSSPDRADLRGSIGLSRKTFDIA